MRLASYNIQYGFGRDGRSDLARVLDVVRAADIICLQEVDRHWRRTGMADQPAEIEALMPDRHAVYGPGFDVDASECVSGRVINRRRQFGVMTLSRWPVLSSRTVILPKHDTGPAFNMLTQALDTVIATPSGSLRVLNVHLTHTNEAERLEQIVALKALLERHDREGAAWNGRDAEAEAWQCSDPAPVLPGEAILLGDFNAEPDSAEYRLLTGDRDNGGFGLADCHTLCGHAPMSGVTFFRDEAQDADHDMRIDYAFVTKGLTDRVQSCRIDEATAASDHQPVFVELCQSLSGSY